jgi:hypothetical protein
VNLKPPQAKNTHHIFLMLHIGEKQNNWFEQSVCNTVWRCIDLRLC